MPEDIVPGPDGFLPRHNGALRAEHDRLSAYLLAEEQRSSHTEMNLAPWRKLAKKGLASTILAILGRFAWLREHDSELPNAHLARIRLAGLLRALYKIKAIYNESELRSLLDATTPLLGQIEPNGPVELVDEFLKTHGLTPELCASLRHFQNNLRQEMSVNQASMQSLRQQLHIMLWMDEWEPLDPSRCWSECVRRDFRSFTGARREKWRALLKHLRGNGPVRMPAGWAKKADSLLNGVGLDDFREQMYIWFTPFRSGQPVPLTVAGSHVIKGLIWYSSISQEEELKQICLLLLGAKWKQKKNVEKVLTGLAQFGVTRRELEARQLLAPPKSDTAARLIEKLKSTSLRLPSNHIQMDPGGEIIIVQGQMHFYRLFRSSGRIERATDNAELTLNWPAVPDSLRLYFHRECDSPEQLSLRTHLLIYDAVYSGYFVAGTA
jgi:hypothetical protein